MKIIVNGNAMDVGVSTIAELVAEMGYGEAVVATAVNMSLVRKKDRAETRLREGDRVEILIPMQGG